MYGRAYILAPLVLSGHQLWTQGQVVFLIPYPSKHFTYLRMFYNSTAADTYIIAPFIVLSFLSTFDQVHTLAMIID